MKFLVCGSLNIDYVYNVDHLVRDGETINSLGFQRSEGGKGLNQAVALAKAGAEVYFAGAIGQDGVFLLDFLSRFGVDTRHVQTPDAPTGHALIQVDREGRNAIIIHGGANRRVEYAALQNTLQSFGNGDVILLQNEINGLSDIIHAARKHGIGIALNPSPISDELRNAPLELVDWLILNEVEGNELTGKTADEDILAALLEMYPSCAVVLTLGTRGAIYADGSRRHYQPAIPVNAVDTTAAGDTFTGYFLQSALSGMTIEESLRVAACAASITVSRAGAARSIPVAAEVSALSRFGSDGGR